MKTYKYILLDWDGNIAKTLDIWLDAYRDMFTRHGLYLTDEEIAARFGDFPVFMRELGIPDVETVFEEARAMVRSNLKDVELYPDALMVLEKLHEQGKKLALITTSERRNVEHLLEKYNLDVLFEAVVTGNDVTHHKPHPEPLEKALSMLGGIKEHAVMIGDSSIDVEGAKNTGVDSILFHSPEHEKFYKLETLKRLSPTYVAEDFKQILDLV